MLHRSVDECLRARRRMTVHLCGSPSHHPPTAVAKAISTPAWGVAADTLRNKKAIALTTRVMSTLLLLLLGFPFIVSPGFWPIYVISICSQLFSSSGILDAYTLDTLGEAGQHKYGQYRVWLAISWGVGSIASALTALPPCWRLQHSLS